MPSKTAPGYNVTQAIFARAVQGDVTRPAVYYQDQVWTYGAVIRQVYQVSNGLRTLGVEPEQRVVILGYDSPYTMAALFGAMHRGAVPIPLNTSLPMEDYLYYLEDSRAKVLFVESAIWAQLAPALRTRDVPLSSVILLPSIGIGLSADEAAYAGPLLFYREWVEQQSVLPQEPRTRADDPAFWLYSSGSTGAPKAAVHLHKDMMVCNRLYAEGILHITQQDRLFSASKLFFAYGLGNGSYFALANEASVVLEPRKPDALTVLQDIAHYRPTIFFGVPTLFNAILRHPQSRDYDLSSLRACVSAGEPLPAEIYTRWKTAYGVEILDGIGSTEVLHIYISNRPGQSTPGNTGAVVPGYAVQILDDQMHVVDPGTVGDLYVQGDSISPYYWGQYQKTRRSMVGEWFKTGDKYYEDGDGHFVYCGRSDDMIKAGGIWVSPIEVENVLLEHPAVAETAVIGALDADDLAKPVAYVVLGDEENPSERLATELQEFVKSRLAHYKYPREIHFVEELPKTASGKIQRYRLRNGMVTS